MKIFATALVLVIAGLGIWALLPDNKSNDVAVASSSPAPTDYIDYSTPTPISSVAVIATSAPTPTKTPVRTATPTPLGQGGQGPKPVRTPVFANMISLNGSGEYGVVALTANSNDLAKFSFNLSGFPAGMSQSAYIANGTCSNIGSKVYNLNHLLNGSSTTTLNVNFLDIAQSQNNLVVVVNSPAEEFPIPYSCGQLR